VAYNKTNDTEGWNVGGIYAEGSTSLRNCEINNNTGNGVVVNSVGGGTRPYSGPMTLTSNVINNNTGTGVYAYYSATLTNNEITDNGAGGFYGYGGTITLTNNIIKNNENATTSYFGGNGGGITIFAHTYPITLTKNVICNNSSSFTGGGVTVGGTYAGGTVILQNNVICKNKASSTGGGVDIGGGSGIIISNNIISNNTGSDGGGIRADYYATPVISGNSIINNTASNATGVKLNSYGDNKDFKFNTITGNQTTSPHPTYTVNVGLHPFFNYNNIFNNIATYELWNENPQGSPNLNAENNWWGTAVESEIQAKIYDWFDDSGKGIVNYSPWETAIRTDAPISPPTGFTATMGADSITLNWSPNPEADLAGYKVYYSNASGFPYANVVDVGNVTNYTINAITSGTYFVAVTAYDTTYNPANDDPNTIVNENQTNGNESWFSQEQMATDLVLYDDFSGTRIDRNKWRWCEFVREIDSDNQRLISKLGSPNPNVVGTYPYSDWNWLSFPGPNSVNSIQTNVMILENAATNSAQTRARLGGRWYNDGTSGEGTIGDIWAEVSLTGGPTGLKATWGVVKFTNADGTTWVSLGGGDFTTPVSFGTPHVLYVSYDSTAHQFRFRIGTEEVIFGPTGLPGRVGDPKSPWKAIGTRVQIDNPTASAYISAAFDNVYRNGELYDDFSSPTIGSTKWTAYEFVREIHDGKLRSKIRSSSAYTSFVNNELLFAYPKLINAIQANVTLLDYQNPQGLFEVADISGTFFNDGTPGGGQIGDLVGQVFIGGNGVNPIAAWRVYKYTDVAGNVAETVASGAFTTSVVLGNTYTLFLAWDGNKFTFKFDTEEAYYTPVISINPVHVPFRRVRTQIVPGTDKKDGTIEALFDDVMVEIILPGDCNGDGGTTIDEVQRAINQFLGISAVQPCCDLNGNGQVTIDEVQRVINAFLGI
jgi:hypothetical protein